MPGIRCTSRTCGKPRRPFIRHGALTSVSSPCPIHTRCALKSSACITSFPALLRSSHAHAAPDPSPDELGAAGRVPAWGKGGRPGQHWLTVPLASFKWVKTRRSFRRGICVPAPPGNTPRCVRLPCRLHPRKPFDFYSDHTPPLRLFNHLAEWARHRVPPRPPQRFPR